MKESPQESLASSNQPQSNLLSLILRRAEQQRADEQQRAEQQLTASVVRAFRVRNDYRAHGWSWGAPAEYLYRELIRTLGLAEYEKPLLQRAKSKPGRKSNDTLFERVQALTDKGRTVKEIQKTLEDEGLHYSDEAIAAYRKRRRKARK
jgi:hypothetical protein